LDLAQKSSNQWYSTILQYKWDSWGLRILPVSSANQQEIPMNPIILIPGGAVLKLEAY